MAVRCMVVAYYPWLSLEPQSQLDDGKQLWDPRFRPQQKHTRITRKAKWQDESSLLAIGKLHTVYVFSAGYRLQTGKNMQFWYLGYHAWNGWNQHNRFWIHLYFTSHHNVCSFSTAVTAIQELLLRMLMKSRVLERRKLRKATTQNISQRVSCQTRGGCWVCFLDVTSRVSKFPDVGAYGGTLMQFSWLVISE